jgi:hypothetical protein
LPGLVENEEEEAEHFFEALRERMRYLRRNALGTKRKRNETS